jgi:chemotaxis signal transduction protein
LTAAKAILVFEFGSVAERTGRQDIFAIDVDRVLHVIETEHTISVPLAPTVVEGIINHHGRILTIVDPAPLVRLPRQPQPIGQVVILRRRATKGGHIGLKVMRIREIISLTQLEPCDVVTGPGVKQVLRHERDLIHVLSYEAILSELDRCFDAPAANRPSVENQDQGVRP